MQPSGVGFQERCSEKKQPIKMFHLIRWIPIFVESTSEKLKGSTPLTKNHSNVITFRANLEVTRYAFFTNMSK